VRREDDVGQDDKDMPAISGLITDPAQPGNVKLKLVSDGTWWETRLLAVNHDGNEYEVENCMGIRWSIEASPDGELATLSVKFIAAGAEIEPLLGLKEPRLP
jgi:hypothetical protein